MIILALSGKKGSGKTTAAKYLVDNYDFVRTPLAKKIKTIAKKEFNLVHPKDIPDYGSPDNKQIIVKPEDVIDRLHVYADLSKGVDLNNEELKLASIKIAWYVNQYHTFQDSVQKANAARKVYQLIGTEFFRTIDESIWIDYLIEDIENLSKEGINKFVIDDLRFPNEFQKLREKYGNRFILMYIEPRKKNELLLEDVNDNHASESYFNLIKQKADTIVENDYTDMFLTELDQLVQSYLSKSLI